MYATTRYHDFSAGHRVTGHENKCGHLHGHNYRVHFTCESWAEDLTQAVEKSARGELDDVGRVVDFAVIRDRLCQWLEDHWDHVFLIWEQDGLARTLRELDFQGVRIVSFNPTAENMARYLVEVVGPQQLRGTGVRLSRVVVEETTKCSASYEVCR